ncbi:MAG: CHAT domain-containing protein [Planctomycetes bacterium]|nr:CHAT domain-containing protein [Planctomycetota bacterium]
MNRTRLALLLALAVPRPLPAQEARRADPPAIDEGLASEEGGRERRAGQALEREALAVLRRALPPDRDDPALAAEWQALLDGAGRAALDPDEVQLQLEVVLDECRDDALPGDVADVHELVARHAARESLPPELAAALETLVEETLARTGAAALAEPELPPERPFAAVADEALAAWSAPPPFVQLPAPVAAWQIERFAAERRLPLASAAALHALAHAHRGGAPATPGELQQLLRAIDLALRSAPPGSRAHERRLALLDAAAAAVERSGERLLARAARAAQVDRAVQRGDLAAAERQLPALLPLLLDRSLPADFPQLVGAVALRRLGRWDECLALLEAASRAEGEPAFVARAAGEYGIALADLGLLDLAAPWVEREWTLARTLDAPARIAALYHVADLRERQRDVAGAIALLEAALGAFPPDRELASARPRLQIRLAHAQLLAEQGGRAPVGAARASRQSLGAALADPAAALPDRVDAFHLLGLAALFDGDPEAARAAVAAAQREVDAAGAPPQGLLARALRETVLASAALRDAAGGATAGLLERRDAARAVVAELIEEWRRIAPREGGIGFLSLASRRALLGALVELELRLDPTGEQALARLDEVAALGSLARALPAVAASDGALRSADRFSAGGGALLWLPSWIASRLLLIDAHGVALVPLASELRLAETVQALDVALQLAVSGAAPLDPAASDAAIAALREALLPEAAAQRCAGWRERTVVLGEPLATAPLALLFREGAPVTTLPSLLVGAALAARPRATAAFDVAWLAAPRLERSADPALAALPPLATSVAALGLREAFAGGRLRACEGDEATGEALRDVLAQGTTLLHLFAHGSFDPARRRPAGLLLGDGAGSGAPLWCDQLAAWRGRVDGVVVAACSAARGPRRIGDDSVGDLGGALLAAGARSVLLTHAPVPVAATARLMAAVHREVARGASLAGALAAARRAVDGEAAQVAALFRVVGLGHEPLFPPDRFAAASARAPLPRDGASRSAVLRGRAQFVLLGLALVALLAWLRGDGRRRRRATGSR